MPRRPGGVFAKEGDEVVEVLAEGDGQRVDDERLHVDLVELATVDAVRVAAEQRGAARDNISPGESPAAPPRLNAREIVWAGVDDEGMKDRRSLAARERDHVGAARERVVGQGRLPEDLDVGRDEAAPRLGQVRERDRGAARARRELHARGGGRGAALGILPHQPLEVATIEIVAALLRAAELRVVELREAAARLRQVRRLLKGLLVRGDGRLERADALAVEDPFAILGVPERALSFGRIPGRRGRAQPRDLRGALGARGDELAVVLGELVGLARDLARAKKAQLALLRPFEEDLDGRREGLRRGIAGVRLELDRVQADRVELDGDGLLRRDRARRGGRS